MAYIHKAEENKYYQENNTKKYQKNTKKIQKIQRNTKNTNNTHAGTKRKRNGINMDKDITTTQRETIIFVGYFCIASFIHFDVFQSFDFILYDIILLNVLIVGHDMLPKYVSLNV